MILYSMDDCVYCAMLKARLAHEGIKYDEITDPTIISGKGFATVPQLDNGLQILDFNHAIAWLNGGREV